MIHKCPMQPTEFELEPSPHVSPSDAEGESELTLQTLFDVEETPLLRSALALTGRRAVAEEIVQEVFLQLHVRWAEIDEPRAWLFRSVRNRAINHIRDHRRELLQRVEGNGLGPHPEVDSPEALLLRMEAAQAVRQLLEELEETDRQLVKLKYFENLKYREISERTGLTVGNVGYRLHHLLKELSHKLRPLGIDPSP